MPKQRVPKGSNPTLLKLMEFITNATVGGAGMASPVNPARGTAAHAAVDAIKRLLNPKSGFMKRPFAGSQQGDLLELERSLGLTTPSRNAAAVTRPTVPRTPGQFVGLRSGGDKRIDKLSDAVGAPRPEGGQLDELIQKLSNEFVANEPSLPNLGAPGGGIARPTQVPINQPPPVGPRRIPIADEAITRAAPRPSTSGASPEFMKQATNQFLSGLPSDRKTTFLADVVADRMNTGNNSGISAEEAIDLLVRYFGIGGQR